MCPLITLPSLPPSITFDNESWVLTMTSTAMITSQGEVVSSVTERWRTVQREGGSEAHLKWVLYLHTEEKFFGWTI